MLVSLAIRNVVLIDQLELAPDAGLGVLTGETGAGKSILLDALGLALGARADSALVRHGSDQASVTAAFEIDHEHPALAHLREQDFALEEEALVLRRVLSADGRSRAFVNDQPVSVGLLRALGERLVEVQGQFAQHGLLDPATHLGLLDAHGGLRAQAKALEGHWQDWRAAERAFAEAQAQLEQARRDDSFLRHALEELDELDPQEDEEERLAEERRFLMHGERLSEALNVAATALGGDGSDTAERALAMAQRALDRVADKAGGRVDELMGALDRAVAEVNEAQAQVSSLSADLEFEPGRLATVEERYFALKEQARKHGCEVQELPQLRRVFAERLEALDSGETHLAGLKAAVENAREAYLAAAGEISDKRGAAAESLQAAVQAELAPLRLDKAHFFCRVQRRDEEAWGPQGIDRVVFEVSTNPGAPGGPLAKIASGGELSRLLLALKVVLAEASPVTTLIFDEVDSGVGGATAAAVGERLARLAEQRQVLVVTHSPQVAALGRYHWQVRKETAGESTVTRVVPLDAPERQEEVARMLSGTQITQEARAAAGKLMARP
ncbi:DNA repair protein RecN [Aquibaculum arenosum]|uniref:DNA repair protein RecN n=1 Tax=Aquibaculum arenosum TaxID=3032591 RepID=A0ABT5YSL7_9PROT|nr:DNA repair protein RecN [Fodinicurvata sp. CAU 1616]MDF2097209.1 DNA repair protein RecN [Fodinicurvata sp. CAU 1616]